MTERLPERKLLPRLVETVRHYWDLGFVAFGGPGVHVVILRSDHIFTRVALQLNPSRQRFVEKLQWVDSTTFIDLFALGNALPGPGSTQLAFSIATFRNGPLAGLIALLCWSVPGAIGMAALGAGVQHFPPQIPQIVLALLTGLNAAAVGLIALAAYQLSNSSITDRSTRLIVLGSASIGVCYHAPWVYPVLIAGGGFTSMVADYRKNILSIFNYRRRPSTSRNEQLQVVALEQLPTPRPPSTLSQRRGAGEETEHSTPSPNEQPVSQIPPLIALNKQVAGLAGLAFILLILVPLVIRSRLAHVPISLQFFTNMVVAGVIIFGGGPVVIPLLRGYTVQNGWVSSRDFLLGFAILQAFPGPNFNFAVYLGVLSLTHNPVLGGFLGLVGIFSPGILLKLALLPVYSSWRRFDLAKSALRGLNAAASGLVWTAVWQLFLVGYIYTPASGLTTPSTGSTSGPLTSDPFWGVVAASAFVATQWFGSPPAITIIGGAVAGLYWFGVVNPVGRITH